MFGLSWFWFWFWFFPSSRSLAPSRGRISSVSARVSEVFAFSREHRYLFVVPSFRALRTRGVFLGSDLLFTAGLCVRVCSFHGHRCFGFHGAPCRRGTGLMRLRDTYTAAADRFISVGKGGPCDPSSRKHACTDIFSTRGGTPTVFLQFPLFSVLCSSLLRKCSFLPVHRTNVHKQ